MAVTTVYCMYCNSAKVNKHGFQSGKQRYRCQESGCSRSFLLDYKNRGWLDSVGKRHTQSVERLFLTFRARIKRLARKTICFSKSTLMHDTVIGLFINREHFGRNV